MENKYMQVLPGGHCFFCHEDYPDKHDHIACAKKHGIGLNKAKPCGEDARCERFEAPTDESWEIAYGRLLDTLGVKYPRVALETAVFIKELLQKEKEKERRLVEEHASQACDNHRGKAFEAGKSEAFSLAKRIIKNSRTLEEHYGAGIREQTARDQVLTDLLDKIQ